MARRVQTVLGSGGSVVCERCTVADTFLTRFRGLQGRRELPRGDGLLLSPSSSIHMFFMRFPIDAVFLDREMRVVGVAPHVRPWRLAGRRGARHVLELPAGEAEARGVRTGDRLELVEPSERATRRRPAASGDHAVPAARIALLARDRRFVRVASFLLSRHGYVVATAHTPRELESVLEGPDADVVVVDGSDPASAAAPAAALLATLPRPRGLVVVGEAGDRTPWRAPVAVGKWSSFDRLLDEIERAYLRTRAADATAPLGSPSGI